MSPIDRDRNHPGETVNTKIPEESNAASLERLAWIAMPEEYKEIQAMAEDSIKKCEAAIVSSLNKAYRIVDQASHQLSQGAIENRISDSAEVENTSRIPIKHTVVDETANSENTLTELLRKSEQEISAIMREAQTETMNAVKHIEQLSSRQMASKVEEAASSVRRSVAHMRQKYATQKDSVEEALQAQVSDIESGMPPQPTQSIDESDKTKGPS